MCHLRNIAMRDYQESVTTKKVWLLDRQMVGRTDRSRTKWSLCHNVPLCFAGDTKMTSSVDTWINVIQSMPITSVRRSWPMLINSDLWKVPYRYMWWYNYWKWPMHHKNNWHTLVINITIEEQYKSSDIEQQPPLGKKYKEIFADFRSNFYCQTILVYG